ncbi:ABC transporter related protein [Pseudodesulfovibrio mercurii]|uniref:ABC transporter related protein n=1 Tax=Pseudodesulfovibrio mercurii TaxID=641491 RepID=F0JC40_9BACT|nr:ABC transporter ATP-binding protein [Pseudodesulfovibrio mercurii]EGB15613.1 ABC transporter related protein [Pseudodesulfovibrio mercurii]
MIFELCDVHARYGKNTTLHGVSLALESREVVCLLGPNGAGKSTLFKVALGFLPTTSGRISCDGEDISGWSRARIARTIGYIPQSHAPTFQYRSFDMVLMGRTAHLGRYATPSAKDRDLAEAAMEHMSILHLRNALFSELSGGERQLILIARALAQNPRFLIMDEPTNNLDFGNQVLVLRHVQALARDGLGIIMATHYPDHAFRYADKAVLIKGGVIVGSGTPETTATEQRLNDLYGVGLNIADACTENGHNSMKVCIPAICPSPAPQQQYME